VSVSTNDLKNGMTLEIDGTLFNIVEFQHVKPGKGGAFVRTKLRNVRTGAVVERTFNAGVKVGLARVERKEMQYLYRDGENAVFMDLQTYEQLPVPADVVGDMASYLTDGATASVATHDGTPISVELPASVALTVAATPWSSSAARRCRREPNPTRMRSRSSPERALRSPSSTRRSEGRPRTGPWTASRRSTARSCGSRPSSSSIDRTCRWEPRSTRPWRPRRSSPRTSRDAS